jgi:uncharacterized protein
MLVKIEEIGEKGLRLTDPVGLELLTAALSEERARGFSATAPAPAKLTLERVGRGVLLTGEIQLDVVACCDRCLAEVPQRLPIRFMLNLVPEPQAMRDAEDDERGRPADERERAGSFVLGEVDEEAFDGQKIDLDPIVREQVLLALPMRVICRDDCKGLCPSCGQDLNVEKCACEPRGVDPRLAVLKNIKLN